MQTRLASPPAPAHGLVEALMGELSRPRDLEVEIQIVHDDDRLVSIEMTPDTSLEIDADAVKLGIDERNHATLRFAREHTLDDFTKTARFTRTGSTANAMQTLQLVRHTAPYELIEIEHVAAHHKFTQTLGPRHFAAARREMQASGTQFEAWFSQPEDVIALGEIEEAPAFRPLRVSLALVAFGLAVAAAISLL